MKECKFKIVSYSTLRLIWKCTSVSPTQNDKNGVFYAIVHSETSCVSEWKMATFSKKMTKKHSFFNFTICVNFKKQFCVCRNFLWICPQTLALFSCCTEEILWFNENGTFTNHSKTSGVSLNLPSSPQTALKFALKDFSQIIVKHRGDVKCAFFDVIVI